MSIVVSYARVSSGKQRREGHGLQRQIDQAAAWANERGLTLDHRQSFSDAGLSASKGHHLEEGAALHGILQAASQGLLGADPTLIVEDISRLSRLEPLDSLEKIFLPLIRSGCRIVLLEDGSTYDADTLNQDQGAMLMLVLKIQAAAAYARKLKTYALSHRARNRQQILDGKPACPGWAPSWIEYIEDRWQLNSYAPTVARLIELLWTIGTQTTAATLNREGHLSPTGKPWTQGGVRRLLENPAICGIRRIADPDHAGRIKAWKEQRLEWLSGGSKGDPPAKPKRNYAEVPDTYPALLTQQEYQQLIAVIRKRSTAPKERGRRDQIRYVGQMISHCICGARIAVRHVKAANGNRYSYLGCRGRELASSNCRRPAIRLEPVQLALLIRLRREHLAPLVERGMAGVESQAQVLLGRQAALQVTLAGLEQQLANARAALKERAKAGRSLAIYEEAAEESFSAVVATNDELSAVLADLAGLQGDGLTDEMDAAVKTLLQTFANGDSTPDQRRAVNQLLLKLDAAIVLDTAEQRMSLAIGDGEPDWQPIPPVDLTRSVLGDGPHWRAVELIPGSVALVDGEIDRAAFDAAAERVKKQSQAE